MNINSTKNTFNVNNDVINRKNSNRNKHRGYTKGEKWVIIITILITLLGILLRSWRIIREGMPIAFDVYHFQEEAKQVFFKGWFNFEELYRDPPGMYFIFVIAEFLLGLPGKPIMWSFFVIPQVIAAIQLIIFYVLARRLTQSRMIGLLSMLVMSFVGVIVYRNQNGAPETIVLGLIPFLVFYLLRFLETDDIRYMFIAILTTIAIVLIHHLTTFIALVIWHIILIYDFIYRHIKKKQFSYKIAIINLTVLILLDSFVFIFWIYVLKNYPLEFINNSFGGLFPENQPIVPTILLIVGVIIINLILLSIFFYNFNRKRINSIIVISGVVSIFLIFILVLFYGTASPDTSITAALLFGTPILV
ncbi:MAG: hypothetical protein EAX90_15895, partial [Candidatus Heimdallarchaeota archaeon]|nr:hypothetical protein [Candidatus Heimdallarchaeota archaeon]